VTFSPADLSPVAWYDVNTGGSSTQITDSSGNARAALTFGAGSNSPTFIDAAVPQLYGSGAAGLANGGSTYAPTTELDIAARVSLRDWTPSSNTAVASRYGTSGSRAFLCRVSTTGALVLVLSSDGTTLTTATSSATLGFTDGDWKWIRWTWRASDGRVQFFYAADGDAEPTWTQLGTDQTIAIASIATPTTTLGIGLRNDGAEYLAGSVKRVLLRTAVGGSLVGDLDATKCSQTGFTDAYGIAWTVLRATSGRKTAILGASANAARDIALAGADDYADGPAAAVPAATSPDACTVAAVIRPFATQAAGNIIIDTRASGATKGLRVEMAGTASVRVVVSDGTSTVTTASVSLTLGERSFVGAILTSSTVRAFVVNRAGITLGAASSRTGGDETGADLRVFNDQALTSASDFDGESECPYIAFTSALTSAQLDQIFGYYDNAARAATAAATATASQAATTAASTAEAAATTSTANDAASTAATGAEATAATATAADATTTATSTAIGAAATATAADAGASVTAPSEAASVGASAHDATTSVEYAVNRVRVTMRESTRLTSSEDTRLTTREH